jgi:hypothetical protein
MVEEGKMEVKQGGKEYGTRRGGTKIDEGGGNH